MSKQKNQRIFSKDHEWLKMLADEQENYIGRDYKLDLTNDCLTVFALPQRRKKDKKKDKSDRDKRREKFERRDH